MGLHLGHGHRALLLHLQTGLQGLGLGCCSWWAHSHPGQRGDSGGPLSAGEWQGLCCPVTEWFL